MATNTTDLVTIPQAAKLLERSRMTLYRWVKKGKVIAVELGGISFIPRSEINRLSNEEAKIK